MTDSDAQLVPASDRSARLACSWLAFRAFSWSLTGLLLGTAAILLSAVINAITGIPIWAAAFTGPAAAAAGFALSSALTFTTAKHVWRLKDGRGTATVVVIDVDGDVKLALFAAVPRGHGLGFDLGRTVVGRLLDQGVTVRAVAWPSTARRYLLHGFVRDDPPGRCWWRLVAHPERLGAVSAT